MPATARNLSSFNKYKLRLPVAQPIRAWMHPASDVRYFVIMSRAMFIAFLNGTSGGGGDLARISRDTRLLSRAAFRNPAGKKILLSLFSVLFFSSVMRASFQEAVRPDVGSFWKTRSRGEIRHANSHSLETIAANKTDFRVRLTNYSLQFAFTRHARLFRLVRTSGDLCYALSLQVHANETSDVNF